MKIYKKSFESRVRFFQGALFALFLAGFAIPSGAQIENLSSKNSSIQINLGGGVSDWQVDSVNQLNQQWFYYSIGSGAVNSIDTISSPSTPIIIPTSNPVLRTSYSDSAISVGTQYTLQGSLAGSGVSTLAQTITLNNPTATSQIYHFYQYSDFDLAGVTGGQNVQFLPGGAGAPTVMQTGLTGGPLVGTVTALSGGSSVLPEVQAGLNNGSMFGLMNGSPAPLLNNTLTAGPGDVVYAYEWDVTLSPTSSLQLSEIETIGMTQPVPEPSSWGLVSSGLLVLTLLRRRHRRGSPCHCS
jgi:hypothetical protein